MSPKLSLLKVARPQFLISGLALFVLGVLWAMLLGAEFSLVRFLLGYLIVLSSQLAVHFSNDYFDVDSDQSSGVTFISGGAGVLIRYPELREPAKWIAIGLILFSLATGMLLMYLYSYPILLIALIVFGNLVDWCYSAPPFRLSSRGLGEFCYGFIGGFLVPGMAYMVMRGSLDRYISLLLFPLTLYALVSIVSVEIPDLENDRLAKKKNWVARAGRRFAFTVIGVMLLAATAYFFFSPYFYRPFIPVDLRVFGLFSLVPLAAGTIGMVRQSSERKLATKIAISIVIALVIFAVLVDGYLFYLTLQH